VASASEVRDLVGKSPIQALATAHAVTTTHATSSIAAGGRTRHTLRIVVKAINVKAQYIDPHIERPAIPYT
jgi:hypothetical protein